MNTIQRISFFLLVITFLECVAVAESDRISALEKRVESLEATLNALEPLFVSRYGLIRNCLTPTVTNGEAKCAKKLKPGATCSIVCNPGYIGTPGSTRTSCKEDGFWTVDLQCEIPLVLVSGGTVDQSNNGDSSLELLSFYPSKGCDKTIADIPLAGGSPRSLHNLVYVSPENVLACNGMTSMNEATCDAWTVQNNTWKHHSYPNKAQYMDYMCDVSDSSSLSIHSCDKSKDRKKGRYAAESLHVGNQVVIVGGMVYDGTGHDPSGSVRQLSKSSMSYMKTGWAHRKDLEKKRAFFCSVNIKEVGFLAIGGLGHDKTGNVVEKTSEYRWIDGSADFESISKVADMSIPRSGHGCTGVPGNEGISILVSGGTKGFGQTAMTDVEIFNWKSNSWKNVASMKTGRFGHAVVTVGEKIFSIGGDDRNPNNILDTIEEYDAKQNAWNIIQKKLKKPRANFGYTLVPHSIFDGCVVSRPLNE